MPHASIGSDVIVGFPGETDAHVRASSRGCLDGSPLTHLHVFPIRIGPGTEASGASARLPALACASAAPRFAPSASALTRAFRASQVGTVRARSTVDDGRRR